MNSRIGEVKGQPEVIFFDAAGTLIRLEKPVGWHYADVAGRHGLRADPRRMEAEFRTMWGLQPSRVPSPGPRLDDDRPWWRTLAFETLERAADVPGNFDRDAWFEDLYARFAAPGVWRLFEDADSCLERLRQRYRLAIISNFDRRLLAILSGLGIEDWFEEIVISSEAGCEKPDAAIFRLAVEAMGVEPCNGLHVGDDPDRDWAGAEAVGLSVYRLRRPETSLDGLQ